MTLTNSAQIIQVMSTFETAERDRLPPHPGSAVQPEDTFQYQQEAYKIHSWERGFPTSAVTSAYFSRLRLLALIANNNLGVCEWV